MTDAQPSSDSALACFEALRDAMHRRRAQAAPPGIEHGLPAPLRRLLDAFEADGWFGGPYDQDEGLYVQRHPGALHSADRATVQRLVAFMQRSDYWSAYHPGSAWLDYLDSGLLLALLDRLSQLDRSRRLGFLDRIEPAPAYSAHRMGRDIP